MSEKIIVCISLCIAMASLLLLTITGYYWVAAVARLGFGFFQTYLGLYFPAWIDTFAATRAQKTLWLSAFMLTPFFSYLMGYVLAALVVTNSEQWEITFYAQSCLMLPCVVGLLFTPEKYTDLEQAHDLKR
jgi:MFS family permease